MVESPTRPWSSLSCFEATPSIQVSKYPVGTEYEIVRVLYRKQINPVGTEYETVRVFYREQINPVGTEYETVRVFYRKQINLVGTEYETARVFYRKQINSMAHWGSVVNLSFFNYLSPFCFLLIEFHCSFTISYKILLDYVYYYCVSIRM